MFHMYSIYAPGRKLHKSNAQFNAIGTKRIHLSKFLLTPQFIKILSYYLYKTPPLLQVINLDVVAIVEPRCVYLDLGQ